MVVIVTCVFRFCLLFQMRCNYLIEINEGCFKFIIFCFFFLESFFIVIYGLNLPFIYDGGFLKVFGFSCIVDELSGEWYDDSFDMDSDRLSNSWFTVKSGEKDDDDDASSNFITSGVVHGVGRLIVDPDTFMICCCDELLWIADVKLPCCCTHFEIASFRFSLRWWVELNGCINFTLLTDLRRYSIQFVDPQQYNFLICNVK